MSRPRRSFPAPAVDDHTLGDDPIPDIVVALAGSDEPDLVWRNELGGLTFEIGDRFVKWNPHRSGIDLDRERVRLEWLSQRHPAPQVLTAGADDEAQWLVTRRLPGEHAVGDRWRARTNEAIEAIAAGLRALHTVPIDDVPSAWATDSWVRREPPSIGAPPTLDEPVLVHGDACAPNTLISLDGHWTGHVDLGDLAVGDRWADLAIASMSLDWNFGPGHHSTLYSAYGIDPDEDRIDWFRRLWDLES